MNNLPNPFETPYNPRVFFDIAFKDKPIGRIIFELFLDKCPKTVENFRQFCTGEYKYEGKPIGYKGNQFHYIVKNSLIQGGDILNKNGTGCISIYGYQFEDECLTIPHNKPGLLTMANSGPNSNGCQFIITCSALNELDNHHVVFGEVVEGMTVVRMIENCIVNESYEPIAPITIIECGQM